MRLIWKFVWTRHLQRVANSSRILHVLQTAKNGPFTRSVNKQDR